MLSKERFCEIIQSALGTLQSMPKFQRTISCRRAWNAWLKIRDLLCKEGSVDVSRLATVVDDYRLMEFIVYTLARRGFLTVVYTGGITRKTMPKPRKAWQGIPVTPNRRDMGERLLFYLYTTGNENLRGKRRTAFYKYITVALRGEECEDNDDEGLKHTG